MSKKLSGIIYWVLTGIIAYVFISSAVGKFTANSATIKMVGNLGLSASTYVILGVIEVIATLLFIFPRTGVIGTLLLAAYLGGAIATMLEHGISILVPFAIEVLVWITAVYRFPELRKRVLKLS